MAQFRSILGDIRGSIAGTTFSRNGNAAYMRNRATPVNPRSSGQTESRSALAYVSAVWRTLIQAQQDAWKALAATIPYTDKMGNTSYYSGFQLFVKLNKTLLSNGGIVVESAPAGAPAFPAINWNGLHAEQDETTVGNFTLDINQLIPTPITGFSLQVQATPALSPGINFVNESIYRTTETTASPATASPYDLTPGYITTFGVPTVSYIGKAIFVRLRLIDMTSGFVSPWTEFKTTVAEA